jgi:hypothetical protein
MRDHSGACHAPTGTFRNPSDEYPPTRPGALLVVIAVLLVVVGLAIENWSDLSQQVPRIETALGL